VGRGCLYHRLRGCLYLLGAISSRHIHSADINASDTNAPICSTNAAGHFSLCSKRQRKWHTALTTPARRWRREGVVYGGAGAAAPRVRLRYEALIIGPRPSRCFVLHTHTLTHSHTHTRTHTHTLFLSHTHTYTHTHTHSIVYIYMRSVPISIRGYGM
jgi:hypothetical protein